MSFRKLLLWIHLYLGITAAVILAIAGLTGAYIKFQGPLERWLNPIPAVAAQAAAPDVLAIVSAVESRFAPRQVTSLEIRPPGEAAVVMLRNRTTVFVNPADASVIGSRPRGFASLYNLTRVMRGLHSTLLLGPRGRWIVLFATLEGLLLVLTGAWLWWRKKQWRLSWKGSLLRVCWNLHNASGLFFGLPVFLLIVTGLLVGLPQPAYRWAGAAPAPWRDPPSSTVPADPAAGSTTTLARVLALADSAIPGDAVAGAIIPAMPRGAFAVRKAARTAFVDRYSGALLAVEENRVPTAGDHAYEAVERAHTGAILGLPGRAVMTLASLVLAVLAASGVVMGWKKLVITYGRKARRDDEAIDLLS